MIRFVYLAGIACLAAACSSNKARQDTVGGGNNPTCTTTNVTYTSGVSAIISANGCLGCHGATPTAPFALQTYDQVKAKASETRNGNSVLYGAVAHLSGFAHMPQGGNKISTCDISKIKAWVDAGMPQ
ncbi:MAG TPA: hypothetical protein VGN63_14020 [Flavisolibacter sp.]|jgi:hypothetical protein|nr:hypothetical protein [Flavisolibacter sp.]